MQLEVTKHLEDVRCAAALVQEFVHGCDFEAYAADCMRRSAVERQFEITGEAPNRLAAMAPHVAQGISNYRRIISFRNT